MPFISLLATGGDITTHVARSRAGLFHVIAFPLNPALMKSILKRLYHAAINERRRNDLYFVAFRLRALRYRGTQVHCPCCQGTFRTFLPYGNQRREQAVCPRCNALERNRVLWLYLTRELAITTQSWSVLHFAPERSLERRFKALPRLEYLGADINPALADHVMDIMAIPLPDASMDLVICSHVLGHVPDEGQALGEIRRVLKPEGLAILMTVIDPELATTYEDAAHDTPAARLRHYGEYDLLRRHGRDFGARIAASGLEVEVLDYRLAFEEVERRRLGLGNGEREVLYLCRKGA